MTNKYELIRKKMEDAKNTCGKRFNKVRCPSLKVMADYINGTLDGYNAEIEKTESSKGRQLSSGVYYSRSDYYGNKLIVKKDNLIVLEHDSTQTYRYNIEVVNWIFSQEEKKIKKM